MLQRSWPEVCIHHMAWLDIKTLTRLHVYNNQLIMTFLLQCKVNIYIYVSGEPLHIPENIHVSPETPFIYFVFRLI